MLLSGGLDSATTLAIARDEGYDLYALSFRYGQRHVHELQAAAKIAGSLGEAAKQIQSLVPVGANAAGQTALSS